MKPTIQDTHYIVLHGWIVNRLGLTSDEALVYALIYGYKDGFDQPVAYIAQWLNASSDTARRVVQRLVAAGLLEEKQQSGKPTIYTCRPLANCYPSQVAAPCNLLPHPSQIATPHIYNDIIIPSSSDACAPARERLAKWIADGGLTEWIERLLTRNGFADLDTAALLDQFYDNDFRVRERCEQGERIETLRHFQNWLPKYIQKLNTQNNGNNRTSNQQSGGRNVALEDIAQSIIAGCAAGEQHRN